MLKAIETTGFVNAQHQLLLNERLPITSSRVRVIIVVTSALPTSEKFQATNYEPDIIDALCGALKNDLSSSEEFALCDEEEIKLEEAKWQLK